MRSFLATAVSNNTNLSLVAPGIAEALFATAIGLVAAIPAVLAYNKLSTDMAQSDFDEFVDTVIPVLQERRLFRTAYDGLTLRQNLGLRTSFQPLHPRA